MKSNERRYRANSVIAVERTLIALGIGVFALFSFSSASVAQSFDCSKAKTPTEIAICNSQSLRLKDSELEWVFGQNIAYSRDTTWDRKVSQQKEWLQIRDWCVSDKVCIAHAYDLRFRQLSEGRWEQRSPLANWGDSDLNRE